MKKLSDAGYQAPVKVRNWINAEANASDKGQFESYRYTLRKLAIHNQSNSR